MAKQRVTEFNRTPGNVFVNVSQPSPVSQIHQPKRFYRDWADVSKAMASDTPTAIETPTADVSQVRIYAEDTLTGKRQTLYTGQPTDDTTDLCQAYANLSGKRVELHDAVDAKVYHSENSPIPNLCDWVEVYNADDGTLIFAGLRHEGFDTRCRIYSDRKGVGLRVDFSHEQRSQFYTPRNEQLRYAKQNAKHFAKRYGVPIADAAGVLAITAVAWAAYVVMGVC